MAVIRCSRCGKAFERTPHQVQVCPNCGLRAPLVAADEPLIPEGLLGKPHRAGVAFFLTALVQPIFWPLYLLFTFRPLDKQHGRFHPMAWWIASCIPVLGVFMGIPYGWIGLVRLHRSRTARGLRKGIGPVWFTLVAVLLPLAALGYGAWLQGTHTFGEPSPGAFVFDRTFEMNHVTGDTTHSFVDNFVDTFVTQSNWLANTLVIVLWVLGPALAIALAASSANKLWRVIYFEKGEAWPWREAVPDATPVQ